MTELGQYILYLSETYEGTVHDKKICDIEQYVFPDNFLLRYDLEPENITIEVPYKNTKLNPLTDEQKNENKIISRKRVSIEQAILEVKRLRVVSVKIITHCSEFRNTVMIIACTIHNLRVRSPVRAYTCTRAKLKF